MKPRFALPIILTMCTGTPVFGQIKTDGGERFTLSGRVMDAASGLPIAAAVVRFDNRGHTAITDSTGRFALANFRAATYRLEVSRIGYITTVEQIDLAVNDTVLVRLIPQPIILQGITAVSNRLERRRRQIATAVRAYDASALAFATGNVKSFLRSRGGAYIVPCPSGRGGGFDADCVYMRGGYRRVSVYVDEAPQFGGVLDMYDTSEFELVEYYPSYAMVRLYTKYFLERIARGKASISPIF